MTTKNMQKIQIATTKGAREVDAYVFGNWAAHLPYGQNDIPIPEHLELEMARIGVFNEGFDWTVTLIPTGMRIPPAHLGPMTEQDAILLAQYLNDRLGDDLLAEEVEAMTPGCIVDALHAELLDPEGCH